MIINGRQKILNAFEKGILPKGKQGKGLTNLLHCLVCVVKVSDHWNLKIWIPRQMLQRLPVALAPVKAGNTIQKFFKWNQKYHIFCVFGKRNY